MSDPLQLVILGGIAGPIYQQMMEFVSAILGHEDKSPGKLLGTFCNEQIHNVRAVFEKSTLIALDIGYTPQQVKNSVLVPLISGASLADVEYLQTTWANMLANAADPRTPGFVEPSFPTILKDLTSREVRFLDALFTALRSEGGAHTFPTADVQLLEHNLKKIFDKAGLSEVPMSAQPVPPGEIHGEYMVEADRMGFYMCMDTVIRNRLLAPRVQTHSHDALTASGQAFETYSLTALGRTFIRACQPPPKS